jgi:hypothetical protein
MPSAHPWGSVTPIAGLVHPAKRIGKKRERAGEAARESAGNWMVARTVEIMNNDYPKKAPDRA